MGQSQLKLSLNLKNAVSFLASKMRNANMQLKMTNQVTEVIQTEKPGRVGRELSPKKVKHHIIMIKCMICNKIRKKTSV